MGKKKSRNTDIERAEFPNLYGFQYRCASEFFKRKPELVVLNMQNEIVSTIWQIKPGHFFFGKGKEKITAKTGVYLGHMTLEKDKSFTFHLVDPSQPPGHDPKRIKMKLNDYATALVSAFGAYHEILKDLPAPEAIPSRVDALRPLTTELQCQDGPSRGCQK